MSIFNKQIFNSLRFKLVFGVLVVALPILTFLLYSNIYSINLVRTQVAQSNSNLVRLYMGLLDKDLENIDKFLYKFASEDTSLLLLERNNKLNPDQYNSAQWWVYNELYKNSFYYESLEFFFVYSIENDDLTFVSSKEYGIHEQDVIKQDVTQVLYDKTKKLDYAYDKWKHYKLNQDYYLLHIIKIGNLYIGAGSNANHIIGPLNLMDLGENGKALLTSGQHEPLLESDFFEKNHINLNYNIDTYMLTGTDQKYLVVGEKSSKGDFHLVGVIPDENIIEKLPYLQRIIWLIILATLIILLVSLYLLRKVVLRPIQRLMYAMRKVEVGNIDVRIQDYPTSNEFQIMNETFNVMVSEMRKLKISIYEEKIISQKAELHRLQLQINPHFYLNSLNIVYYLAQEKNFKLIEELSLSMIQYFRFMFKSHMDFVLLKDEITHTKNYLKIQEVRFPSNLSYDIQIESIVEDCYVPPLIVQTFVENTIKHGISLDEPFHIKINIHYMEESDKVYIHIQDSGDGFTEEQLINFNNEEYMNNEQGEHVGIWNTKRRLRLLYPDNQASIHFANDQGALIVISLPRITQIGGDSNVISIINS